MLQTDWSRLCEVFSVKLSDFEKIGVGKVFWCWCHKDTAVSGANPHSWLGIVVVIGSLAFNSIMSSYLKLQGSTNEHDV